LKTIGRNLHHPGGEGKKKVAVQRGLENRLERIAKSGILCRMNGRSMGIPGAIFFAAALMLRAADAPADFEKTKAAAEAGDASAQTKLAWYYQEGRGVAKSDTEAAAWYLKAAEAGDPIAQNNLAGLYADGTGVPKSYADAAKWYRKAADQNVASAQNSLGWMHIRGQGVAKDAIEAATWFKKAAEGGYTKAQINLGEMLFRGEYFASDWVEAYKWFMIAASRGDKEAQRNRDRLAQMMSFDKIDEARARAQAFLKSAAAPQP